MTTGLPKFAFSYSSDGRRKRDQSLRDRRWGSLVLEEKRSKQPRIVRLPTLSLLCSPVIDDRLHFRPAAEICDSFETVSVPQPN
jgi:hypothetical protein